MGAGDFHGRVRDGIGCRLPARATRSSSLSKLWWVGEVLVRILRPELLQAAMRDEQPRGVTRSMIAVYGGW